MFKKPSLQIILGFLLLGVLIHAAGVGAGTAYGAGQIEVGASYSKEMNSLHHAIRVNDHKLLKRLIKSGIDINSKDEKGYTAMHLAAEGNYVETLGILLAAGADTNVKNLDGLAPMDLARTKSYNLNAVKILENRDNFWISLFYIRLRELGILLGLLFAALIHGLTWLLRQKNMAAASLLGAITGGISFLVAFLYLSSPYVGEIHSFLLLAMIISLVAAVVLGYVHALALGERFRDCGLCGYGCCFVWGNDGCKAGRAAH